MAVPGLLKRASTIVGKSYQSSSLQSASEQRGGDKLESIEGEPSEIETPTSKYAGANDGAKVGHASHPVQMDEEEGFDTDAAPSEDELEKQIKEANERQEDTDAPIRMSKRLMSLKRRGKAVEIVLETEQFEYFAGDILTIRGEESDFFVCRVLEDVLEDSTLFRVAWYDRIGDNLYEVSYDDRIYNTSVLTRVSLKDNDNGTYSLSEKSLKLTNRILKESIREEKSGRDRKEAHNKEAGKTSESESDEDIESEISDDEAERSYDESQIPPVKRRRMMTRRKGVTKAKSERPRDKKKTKEKKPQVIGVKTNRRKLIPNPDIDVHEKDPIFDCGKDIPLSPWKLGLKAVLTNDMDLLKSAIEDTAKVWTIFWARSPDIHYEPVHYALLNGNKEALKLMDSEKIPKNRTAKEPQYGLKKATSGTYNFHTFGHAVRQIEASRGSREGNNAFCKDENVRAPKLKFCMKKGISPDLIETYYPNIWEEGIGYRIQEAVRYGHRKLAAHYIKIAVQKEGFGFNFLHHEVLELDGEALTTFKTQSVTKTPYANAKIRPLHCACINPTPMYAQALFKAVAEYTFEDADGWKPVHYAAVCEGPGPLKFLLQRHVDPNSPNKKGETPLMLAAKCGRDANISELLKLKLAEEESIDEAEPPTFNTAVNLNAKSKKTLMALHYAAKEGHESTVRLLIAEGANVDCQAGAVKNNFTPLAFAAQKGHFYVVKALCELNASPDKKVRQKKTALMHATINGHYNVMSYLLNLGVNPDAADSSKNTPVHYAAAYGWYHCLQLLLEAGANPNCSNIWKTTPLAVALMKDHIECADLVLSLNINVDSTDDEGRTILMKEMLSEYEEKMVEKVEFLLKKKGANPNLQDIGGITALHLLATNSVYCDITKIHSSKRYGAALMKDFSVVCCKVATLLLEAGADPNVEDADGETPLMKAVLQNNIPLIDLLVKHGALASKGKNKETNRSVLHRALEKPDVSFDLFEYFDKNFEEPVDENELVKVYDEHKQWATLHIVKALLEGKADVNSLDSVGRSPLFMALEQGNIEVADVLLEHNADPLIGENEIGHNVLHVLACHCGTHGVTKWFSEISRKFDWKSAGHHDKVDNDGYSPFLLACENHASLNEEQAVNSRHFIKTLIDGIGVNIFVQVQEKNTKKKASHSRKNSYKMVSCKENEDNFKDYHLTGLFTCLHFMTMEHEDRDGALPGLEMVLNYVKRRNGFLDTRDRHGRSPIHFAALQRACKAVKSLVHHGASLDIFSGNKDQDHLGTPVYLCVGDLDMFEAAEELLKSGADPNLLTKYGEKSPLMNAVKENSERYAAHRFSELLLRHKANVNLTDEEGKTALHYAASCATGKFEADTDVEDLLLKHKADVAALDNFGRLPLHYAFMDLDGTLHGSHADPTFLIASLCEASEKQGKNLATLLQQQDVNGNTVLHVAAMRGATFSLIPLLKKGSSFSIKNKDGNYPLSLAIQEQHYGFVQASIERGADMNCNLYWPVTAKQLEDYKKLVESEIWVYKTDVITPPKVKCKSSFLAAVENDWEGIALCSLMMGTVPFLETFKVALQVDKPGLLRTILKKQKESKHLLSVDEHGRGLLHILTVLSKDCMDSAWNFGDIAKELINRGLSAKLVDSYGATPLHYAAENEDGELCKIFIDNAPESLDMLDKYGVNPVTAAFMTGIDNCRFNTEVIRLLVDSGTKTLDICFDTKCQLADGSQEYTTVLNDLVLIENIGNFAENANASNKDPRIGCIEYFLAKGGSINFPNRDGRTAIMTAVLTNYKDTVELLLQFKPDLYQQDKLGWSAVHHCVKSLDYGSYENVEILKLLASGQAPLDLKDVDGHTPMYYAKLQGSGTMVEELKKLGISGQLEDNDESMEIDEGYEFTTRPDQYFTNIEIHPSVDAMNELKTWKDDLPSSDLPIPFDGHVSLGSSCEVYFDQATNRHYDCVLTKVNVLYATNGMNLFYKLQVVHHKGKGLWILFNRWGRTGSGNGQHQQTPFPTPKEATDEFMKIFKQKTGNDWTSLPSGFVKKPKKYNLLRTEQNPERVMRHREEKLKDIKCMESPPSNLPESLQTFLKTFCSLEVINQYMDDNNIVNTNCLPFGHLSHESVSNALVILDKIDDLLDSIVSEMLPEEENFIYSKVADLSNEYYMIIPPSHLTVENIVPLNSKGLVDSERTKSRKLLELSDYKQFFLGAQYRSKEIHPLDYCYQALKTHIELMEPKSKEARLILQAISVGGDKAVSESVCGIYRVQRDQGVKNARNLTKGNRYLLWHGTLTAHMIGILRYGLVIDSPHSWKTGRSYGKGIYFSTVFNKAYNYSRSLYGQPSYVLLCEVGLGNIHYYKNNDTEELEKMESCWVQASNISDPKETKVTPYGAKIMCGSLIPNPGYQEWLASRRKGEEYWSYSTPIYDEIMVYDPAQVRIRYIVQIKP